MSGHICKVNYFHCYVHIAVSGYGQDEDKRRSHEAGFNAHLVKPVEPEHLNETLKSLLRR
jgi:CheY-like chemotaxis protein